MNLPKGFVLMDDVEDIDIENIRDDVSSGLTNNNLPLGFSIDNDNSIPSIRVAPKEGLLSSIASHFTDTDKLRARAANIYSISKVSGLSLTEVKDNYELLAKSQDITGIRPGVSDEDMVKLLMVPAIATSVFMAPWATAAGVITFGILDKLIPTDKFIDGMKDRGISDDVIKIVELVDFIGKGFLAHGITTGLPKTAKLFTKQKIVKYKLPEKVTLKPEQVRDIFQTGKLTTAEQKSLFNDLELTNMDIRVAFNKGVDIKIPSEKLVTIADKPIWAKVKNMFGMEATTPVVTKTVAGKVSSEAATKGLISGSVEPVTVKKVNAPAEVVSKITKALKTAKTTRGKQETIYQQERAIKYSKLKKTMSTAQGEKGFYKELASLKGEMTKAEFESVRSSLTQEDVDVLFQTIRKTPALSEWDKINAMKGMAKLVGEKGTTVPTDSELALLGEVYGNDFVKIIMSKRGTLKKIADFSVDLINVPRSLMSAADLSAPLRQGLFLINKPGRFFPAFIKMFPAFGSEKAYTALIDSIINDPMYQISRDAQLSITNKGQLKFNREEKFLSSLAEKIPLMGKLVVASERAYIGFLNKLRFDVFKDLVNKAENTGVINNSNRFDMHKEIANFINNATGRGTLPKGLRNSAAVLNGTFFSPRLFMSRLTLLNPVYYVKSSPFVRKEALKSLFSFLGIGITILGTLKAIGFEIGTDPKSTDFGKVIINNTRFDIWGGFQPFVVLATRLVTGKTSSSTSNKTYKLGEGYKGTTRLDLIQRFFSSKLAPFPKLILNILKGKDFAGKELDLPKEVMSIFTPMILQDLYDIYEDDPTLIPAGLTGAFGVGVQTYKPKRKKL